MYILGIVLFVLLWWASGAEAACSGSGQTWSCTAGSTIANVNSAVSSGSDGMTITFASGSYNWSSGTITLSNSKGTTLACASVRACAVTASSNTMIELFFSGTNNKFYRITGFAFSNSGSVCATCIWFYGDGTLTQFRIDHNTWTGYTTVDSDASALTFFGSNANAGFFYGVIDHNTVNAPFDNMLAKVLGHNYGHNWVIPFRNVKGTSQNIFVEDNTFNITNGFSNVACLDSQQGAAVVWRYNTMTNCRGTDSHGMPHGGTTNYEIYRNHYTKTNDVWSDCTRCILHQGAGEMYFFDNDFTPLGSTVSSAAITIQHHRSGTDQPGGLGQCDGTKPYDGNTSPIATHRGYPCINQPGRMEAGGTPLWGKLAPLAVFRNRNTKDGAKVDVSYYGADGSPNYSANHFEENRDGYLAVSATEQTSTTSPFNGTTGIGHGTLANRPTTCTHITSPDGDNGGGVMYWATDQGSWNASGPDGVLYRCSATNTWVTHYTPYTYPHPLQAGGGEGDITPPNSPTNLRIQ